MLTADNMFRTWEAEVGGLLRPGGEANRIRVRIASPLPAMAAGQRRRPLHEWNCYDPRFAGRGHVRKQACSFCQRLIAAGCHQITSNDPDALADLVERLSARPTGVARTSR